MSNAAYSDLKAAWHLERIEGLRRGETIAPSQVQLILSDLCNQDCGFCSYRMSNGLSSEQFVEHLPDGTVNRNPKRMISQEKAEEILRDCAAIGVHAIQFTGGGEPTVHPHHMELFELALSLGMECGLVTNGVLFRKGWEDALPRFAWVRVSLDAGRADTYARIRRTPPAMFGRALGNTMALAAEIERQGSKCLLGMGYVVTPDNWLDIEDGVEAVKGTGAAYVRLSAMFSTDHDSPFAGIHPQILDAIKRAKRMATPRFAVVDLFGDRIADLRQEHPDYTFCGYQHFNVYVGGNLKVYRCCSTAYTLHGEVGDLKERGFAEWWRSPEAHAAYFGFNAKSCGTCQFNSRNRIIDYLVKEDPLHVAFV